jgi:SAM-dependent methyltransferase
VRIDLASLHHTAPLPYSPAAYSGRDRARPSLLRHDYLSLDALGADVERLLGELPRSATPRQALDLGCDSSPYGELLARHGYSLRTLDLTEGSAADFVGTAEDTRLPAASFDLVLCTQVLEHCDDPWRAMREIHRILRPGGYLLASAPHVWFYHPHPTDHWRFTQQGMAHLCRGAGFDVQTLLSQGGTLLAAAQVANFLAFGVLGRAGAPLYALVNVAGKALDRLVRNELFCINFAVLARRT